MEGVYRRKDRQLERAALHVLRCEHVLGEGTQRLRTSANVAANASKGAKLSPTTPTLGQMPHGFPSFQEFLRMPNMNPGAWLHHGP
jgi:hypothetical protein